MTTIRIQRASVYQNLLRTINIVIDGQKVGTIKTGETKEFTVEPGHHKVVATIDWCRSQKLHLECLENTIYNIQLSGNKTAFLSLYYTTIARKRYLTLTEIN